MQTACNALMLTDKKYAAPLKNHPQIPIILDTLYRLNQHHILLQGPPSKKLRRAFCESIALCIENIECIYWDLDQTLPMDALIAFISTLEKLTVFIFDGTLPHPIQTFLKTFIHDSPCRFIIFDNSLQSDCDTFFAKITWEPTCQSEIISLLKIYKEELEFFHGVTIADNLIAYAHSLSTHYLGGESIFDTVMTLIDSTCSRAKRMHSAVSAELIAEIVSDKTQIPTRHLHHNKFKTNQLIPAIKQQIFGQDTAIHMISVALQSIPLQPSARHSPLASFLLVGQEGVGKKKIAIAMAHYLFGTQDALLQVMHPTDSCTLQDLRVKNDDDPWGVSLLSAISSKPYAIILFENIDVMKNISAYLLEQLFANKAFRHCIMMMTTTQGSDKLIAKDTHTTQHATPIMDLMQLVLNENPLFYNTKETPQASLHEKILQDLKTLFTTTLLQNMHIIPCMPLEVTAYEKLIQLKLQQFAKLLENRFQIELQFAPEVIQFLLNRITKPVFHLQTLEKIFAESVHPCISHAVFSRMDNVMQQHRLLLTLNDSGQLLKCEFAAINHKEHYT